MDWFEPFVSRTSGVQGGAPVLDGTRTPVGTIVAYAKNYHGDMEQLTAAFPHLTPRQISAALAYYECHQAEVDADERRHMEAWDRLLLAV